MGLRRITGTTVVVDLERDVRQTVDPPMLVFYNPATAYFKRLALGLLGVTAFRGEAQLEAVRRAAAALDEADDADWTQADARQILSAAGTTPVPSHIRVERVKGEGILLLRAVAPETAKSRRLRYSGGSVRPSVSLLAAIRPEGIAIPKGMAMEVPVKLVETNDGLALALYLRRGKVRDATRPEEEDAQST